MQMSINHTGLEYTKFAVFTGKAYKEYDFSDINNLPKLHEYLGRSKRIIAIFKNFNGYMTSHGINTDTSTAYTVTSENGIVTEIQVKYTWLDERRVFRLTRDSVSDSAQYTPEADSPNFRRFICDEDKIVFNPPKEWSAARKIDEKYMPPKTEAVPHIFTNALEVNRHDGTYILKKPLPNP